MHIAQRRPVSANSIAQQQSTRALAAANPPRGEIRCRRWLMLAVDERSDVPQPPPRHRAEDRRALHLVVSFFGKLLPVPPIANRSEKCRRPKRGKWTGNGDADREPWKSTGQARTHIVYESEPRAETSIWGGCSRGRKRRGESGRRGYRRYSVRAGLIKRCPGPPTLGGFSQLSLGVLREVFVHLNEPVVG